MPAIELDLIIAFLNRADRLHSIAARVFEDIAGGRLVGVAIPSSALLELELVLRSRGVSPREVEEVLLSLKNFPNIGEIPLTSDVQLRALGLREAYSLTFFDSLHAASALEYDRMIISVDEAYRRVPGLKALDPRELPPA